MEHHGIGDFKKRSFSALSGGQQQRVLLARALCATDKLLLLDEPVTGLDPLVTEELYQLIEQLNRDLGVTIIMVSHAIYPRPHSMLIKYCISVNLCYSTAIPNRISTRNLENDF